MTPSFPLAADAAAAPLAFVEVKAFGDLTITAASLRRLPADCLARSMLVIGSHLADLCRVLAPPCKVEVIETGCTGVPALFDLKKSGLRRAAVSAFHLRRAVSGSAPGRRLVFECLRRRERFVAGRRDAIAVPGAANIYQAYQSFLESAFCDVSLAPIEGTSRVQAELPRRVGLFPLSRVATKNCPPPLVAEIARHCLQRGFEPVIVLLEGEDFEAPSGIELVRIPRRFDALATEIARLGAVISTDSLPAHLAGYAGRPVFVVSPVPNEYWFPASVFAHRNWALFSAPDALDERLDSFLSDLT